MYWRLRLAEAGEQRIRDDLASKIARGEFPVGSELPSVESLAEQWGVSTATVQRAVRPWRVAGILARYGTEVLRVPTPADIKDRSRREPAPVRLDRVEESLAEVLRRLDDLEKRRQE